MFEEQLVEHPPDVLWCLVVGGRGVLGQIESLDDECLLVSQILLQGLDVLVGGSQTAGEALLLALEHLQGDGVFVVSLEELGLLVLELVAGGGELTELLLRVLDHDGQLVAQRLLQGLTALWWELDLLVQPFDLILDEVSQGGAEGALRVLLGVPTQADEVLVGDLLRCRLRDDQSRATDAAVDRGLQVVRVADGPLTVDLAAQDGLDTLEGLGVSQGLVGPWVERSPIGDLAGVERIG